MNQALIQLQNQIRKWFTIYGDNGRSDCKSVGKMLEILGKKLLNPELITIKARKEHL